MARTPAYLARLEGDQLFKQRARQALPVLVRQAEAGEPIVYQALARELGMPNPRNLDYVLGTVGQSLAALARSWNEPIPPLQFLVVNKTTKVPGAGINEFYKRSPAFSELQRWQKLEIVGREHVGIFAYPKWREVLKALDLSSIQTAFAADLEAASRAGGGGEGPEHLALKQYVASHPGLVDLPDDTPDGEMERAFPSADCIDVSFALRGRWIGVEVKPASAPDHDIVRGLFQCIKYRALMKAEDAANTVHRPRRVVLVLGGQLPARLRELANILAVEVLEGVVPQA